MIKLYGYKKCGTCRKAESVLAKAGVDYTFIDITENPPSSVALKNMAQQASRDLKKMFNTSGVMYREKNIKAKLTELSDAEILKLLASDGRLIKRPVVTDGTKTTVGFDETEFKRAWR